MRTFLRRNYSYLLISLLLLLPICFLLNENIGKGITLILLLLCWLILVVYSNKGTFVSLLFIFLVLPFNITVQIPESVHIFNSNISISDPYVGGLWVNYLVPTLSVLDLFIFLLLVTLFKEERGILKKVVRNKYLWILGVFLLIQSVYVQEIFVLFQNVHLYIYILTALAVKEIFIKREVYNMLLQSSYTNIAVLVLLLVQGIIGIYQFTKGTSLGVHFLGESLIVSGMSGSSFIDINGEALLRAYGTFPHPNLFAGWLILLFVICWILFKHSRQRIFPVINALLILLFSVFTFSRISMILLLLLSFIWVLSSVKRNTLLSVSNILVVRFLNVFSGEDSSWSDRLKLIEVNWKIFRENILFGTGIGNSLKYYAENIPYTTGGKLLLQPVHNIFVLNMVELGILGSIYFWFLHYKVFLRGVQWNIVKLCILLVIILIGMFDHYLLSLPQGQAIFYTFLIVLAY